MPVSLTKGQKVSLTKEAGSAGLASVTVGLGWDVRLTDGADFDLDASAFELGSDGKVLSDSSFVFFGNKASADGSIQHMGDNLTGQGDGDDEQIKIHLGQVGADTAKIAITCTIYEADTRKQNFGMVSNAYIRVVNEADGTELARFDLGEDFSTETAVIFGEVYRNGDEWKFNAVGQGYAGGLAALATNYGVDV